MPVTSKIHSVKFTFLYSEGWMNGSYTRVARR